MTGYTVKNLKDVEDSAAKHGMAPDMEARFASVDLELDESGISFQRLAPDFRLPFGHAHEVQEEVYVVLSGSARMKIDDEIIDLKQWDAVRVAPKVTRGIEAGPDGVELLAFGAPSTGHPQTDTEPLPGWWSD